MKDSNCCCSWYSKNQIISIDNKNISLWNVPEKEETTTTSSSSAAAATTSEEETETNDDDDTIIITQANIIKPKETGFPNTVDEIICYKEYIIINSISSKGVYVISKSDFNILHTYIHNRHIEFFPMCINRLQDIIIISSSNELTALSLKLTEFPLRFPKFRGKATSVTVTYDQSNSILMTTDEGMIWRYRLIEDKKDIKEESK